MREAAPSAPARGAITPHVGQRRRLLKLCRRRPWGKMEPHRRTCSRVRDALCDLPWAHGRSRLRPGSGTLGAPGAHVGNVDWRRSSGCGGEISERATLGGRRLHGRGFHGRLRRSRGNACWHLEHNLYHRRGRIHLYFRRGRILCGPTARRGRRVFAGLLPSALTQTPCLTGATGWPLARDAGNLRQSRGMPCNAQLASNTASGPWNSKTATTL